MPWFNTFDGVFFITIVTIITTFLGLMLKYCLKSKCGEIDFCWGCLKINRNVEIEQEEEIRAMELGIANTTNTEEQKIIYRFSNIYNI